MVGRKKVSENLSAVRACNVMKSKYFTENISLTGAAGWAGSLTGAGLEAPNL